MLAGGEATTSSPFRGILPQSIPESQAMGMAEKDKWGIALRVALVLSWAEMVKWLIGIVIDRIAGDENAER